MKKKDNKSTKCFKLSVKSASKTVNYVIVFGVGSFLDFLETRMIKPFLTGLFDIIVHSFSLKNSKKQKHLYVPWNCVLLLYICSNLWKIKKKCFCLISLCTYYFSETAWCCELVTNFVIFLILGLFQQKPELMRWLRL